LYKSLNALEFLKLESRDTRLSQNNRDMGFISRYICMLIEIYIRVFVVVLAKLPVNVIIVIVGLIKKVG
jgi:hypothetical protein